MSRWVCSNCGLENPYGNPRCWHCNKIRREK